jgi:hypothetical protein
MFCCSGVHRSSVVGHGLLGAPHRRGLTSRWKPRSARHRGFEHLDHYVELELAGRDADAAVPGMRGAPRGCPACDEDHASLAANRGSGTPAARSLNEGRRAGRPTQPNGHSCPFPCSPRAGTLRA